ncbi:MAG: D-2-hydroxyacid dehydrogenase [Gammaproteobacteria bacterium]
MRGVFLDFATVSNGDIDYSPLEKELDELVVHDVTALYQLHERVQGFDIVMTNKLRIDEETMNAAGNLRLINLAATGYNNIDINAARHRGIAVTNIRGYCSDSVAQHVFTLLLALTQHLHGYQALLAEGAWRNAPQFTLLNYPVRELVGKVLGIIGYGELGKRTAELATAFGMEVLIAQRPGMDDKRPDRIALKELFKRADVISLHCPLTPDTENLIDNKALTTMKPTAILINTSRGAVVDENALVSALMDGQIAGAGIDVLSQEPPIDGNPLLREGIPNLIVTPHIAWAARESRQRAIEEMAKNIAAFRNNEMRNRVEVEKS